jgi:hypothetical protein
MAGVLETIPSEALDFTGQKTLGVVASTSHVEIAPKYGGEFKQGDIIRLEIPSQNWFDSEKFRITFRTKTFTDATNNTQVSPYAEQNKLASDKFNQFLDSKIPMDAPPHMIDSVEANGWRNTHLGGASTFFKNGVQHLFNRGKLLQGSNVIEDIQDYGQLTNIMHVVSIPTDHGETILKKEGFGNLGDGHHLAERKYLATKPNGHQWEVDLLLGLFKTGKYLPTKYMGQLTIELYLEQNRNCMMSDLVDHHFHVGDSAVDGVIEVHPNQVSTAATTVSLSLAQVATASNPQDGWAQLYSRPDGTKGSSKGVLRAQAHAAPSYQIDQVYAQCHFVTPIDEYDRAALSQIESGKFEIHFETFRSHNRQIANVSARQTMSIQEKALSVKNVFAVMRNSSSLNSYLHDSPYSKNAIIEYQWKIGNEYFPAQPVDCSEGGAKALTQLQEALGISGDVLGSGQLTHCTYCPEQYVDGDDATMAVYPLATDVAAATGASVLDPVFLRSRLNAGELKFNAALPNQFILGQSFEKSQGQLSGFNTVESQVDIELILRLKEHQSMWPSVNGVLEPTPSAVSFQPTKSPCYIRSRVPMVKDIVDPHKSLQRDGPISYGGSGVATGFATDTNQVTLKDWSDSPGSLHKCMLESAPSTYAQFLAFVHVDAILKMRGLGQIEIVT